MNNYEQHEVGKLLPKMVEEQYQELKNDIQVNGQQFPCYLYEGKVLDGWHRYKITKELDIECKFDEYKGDSPISFMFSTSIRRDLTPSQKAGLALKVLPMVEEESKKNQIRKPICEDKLSSQKLDKGNSAAKVGKILKVGGTYVKDAKRFVTKDVTNLDKLISGDVTIQGLKEIEKIEKRKEVIEGIKESIAKKNLVITDKYDVVVIDPPWPYGREYDPETSRVANPYPEMSIDKIGDIVLPIKDDSVVFLWTTHAFLLDAFNLLTKWGLNYKATMVWDKEKMGMGSTIRMQCEFCLLATKGKPTIQGTSTRDIIREPRRQHSRKPDLFYKLVEDITIGSRLDYFSREQRTNWVSFGAETTKFN